jgi:hypothetical protein
MRKLPIFLLLLLCVACAKKQHSGEVKIHFSIQMDGETLHYRQMEYQNAAGNRYQVDEVKFFISDVAFLSRGGERYSVTDHEGLHYFDSDIASSYDWVISKVPDGQFDSITFVFGLLPAQNVTGFFVNPPENNMAWPDVLGGGYHYMQINGKWLAINDTVKPFNLHTGIGQRYENGQVTEFVHNQFRMTLPLRDFIIQQDATTQLDFVMNVNAWFAEPNIYDFDVIGGSIMQNQAAQEMLRENGPHALSVKVH